MNVGLQIFNEKGSAMVITLLSIAVLSAIGTGALFVSSTNQSIAGNYRKQAQAFYVAEAGLNKALASIKNNPTWRGDTIGSNTSQGSMVIGSITANYNVTSYDTANPETGASPLPGGYIKLVSQGIFSDSTQTVESIISLAPIDNANNADSPDKAVITSGDNTGSGHFEVNGYDDDGNLDPAMVEKFTTLPTVNQDALKAFADFSYTYPDNPHLDNHDVDTDLNGQTDFWKDAPNDTQPYIIHVSGDMFITGNRHVYGIIFVEGDVTLSGNVRVHGVIYAPNASVNTRINGGGNPGDQPVMGQVISGVGGVHASGNHADVQLVKEYVDAFNNFGGQDVAVDPSPGSWRQY
jgi:Tfp pilus assembly protein PilX